MTNQESINALNLNPNIQYFNGRGPVIISHSPGVFETAVGASVGLVIAGGFLAISFGWSFWTLFAMAASPFLLISIFRFVLLFGLLFRDIRWMIPTPPQGQQMVITREE